LHAVLEFDRRQDIHVPAGQAGGQADVLAALADREAELVFVDDNCRAAQFEAERHLGHLGRLERVLDQDL
jgi:hypothetical protein